MFRRGGVWWICIRYGGKKIQKSLETHDKKLAQRIEAKIRTEIVEGKYYERLIGESKTFKDMMEKFMKEHAPKRTISMQRSYFSSLKRLSPSFGDSKLSAITPKMISNYKVLRYSKGVKPSTINKELAMLSIAFNLAMKEWEWVKDNPVSKVQKERENNERDRWLTEDEEKRLLENSQKKLREIIVFALHTGLRQNELLSLQWDKVSLLRRAIIIQESKNGKPRTIPLQQPAYDILVEKFKIRNIRHNFVFTNRIGTKIDRHNLRRIFSIAVKKAGIQDFRFHDLRHTFATRLVQKGVKIYDISILLGHKSTIMTQRYAHHCTESLRDCLQVLESDYNLTTVGEKRNVSMA